MVAGDASDPFIVHRLTLKDRSLCPEAAVSETAAKIPSKFHTVKNCRPLAEKRRFIWHRDFAKQTWLPHH